MRENKFPRVTIGIPTFNRASTFLKKSLGSALAQDYPNLEIIVSDNQSEDETESYLRGIVDSRLRYLRQEKAVEPHENADTCLQEATGDYFLLLHDDDLIDEDFISVCVGSMEGREVGLVHTGARQIDQDGKILVSRKNPHGESSDFEFFVAVLEGWAVTFFCNTLYHTERLRSLGGFRSKSHAYQDVLANLRMVRRYERVEIKEPKASYRIHDSKLGSSFSIESWCRDSLAMIDLMSELMPEKEDYFRTEGKRIMCRKNYGKNLRRFGFFRQLHAHWTVYRKFGFTYSPFEFFAELALRRVLPPRMNRVRA